MFKKDRVEHQKLEKTLSEALEARNVIIHRVLVDNTEMAVNPDSRALLLKEIKNLRRKVDAANQALAPLNLAMSSFLDGVDFETLKPKRKRCSAKVPVPTTQASRTPQIWAILPDLASLRHAEPR